MNEINKINEIIFQTEGMACAKCEARVIAKLSECTGVAEVLARASSGVVKISGENLDQTMLKEAIEDLGFDVLD